jgi:hypothetical protein
MMVNGGSASELSRNGEPLLPRGMFGLAAALGGAKPDGAGPNIPWPRPDAMAGEGIGEAAKPFGVPMVSGILWVQ